MSTVIAEAAKKWWDYIPLINEIPSIKKAYEERKADVAMRVDALRAFDSVMFDINNGRDFDKTTSGAIEKINNDNDKNYLKGVQERVENSRKDLKGIETKELEMKEAAKPAESQEPRIAVELAATASVVSMRPSKAE
jgi:hypothetical protein